MQVEIRDVGDLKRLVRAFRDLEDGKQLRKELVGGLRGVMNPVRDQVKAAYRSAPSGGRRGRGGRSLRSLLAGATRVEVRTSGRMAGVTLRVDGRKMPSGMRSLPSMWEGPPQGKPWRHPVHGDRSNWVAQPSRPTAQRIVPARQGEALQAIDQVMARMRRKLETGR
jgi:hypothetical protein